MKRQVKTYISAVLAVFGMIYISNLQASLDTQTYGFYNITNNSTADADIGESQLSVQVSDCGTELVSFKFSNEGPDDCVITEIYFQDGSILGFASIDESLPGVDFKEAGSINPKNLPGGKSIMPQFTAVTAFSIESLNPGPKWGVGPGEWVEVVYSLQSGKAYMDIIEELNTEPLRIGIHVQSYADGGSESFVNTPEPATMVLLGLGGLVLRKCKK
jgi:hypothetical protein